MTRHRRLTHVLTAVVVGIGAAVSASAVAHADRDTDFAAQLHTYGIYGPKDYNAWLGKIVCQRMDDKVDHTAYQSATFLSVNLNRHYSTEQSWRFLGTAIDYYCPDKRPVLEQVAAQH
ncbi:DUF732 domain-containing protein [Mycobacteroides abscessus subsp. abscessus]|uniref:DUF732 domain-containing protein n=1 Tax=Mycobacteroides abscessus TaxID=36809 RepID=UPI00266DD6CA|nr:DUF732 domain-containing protein [Mycobacteroides abscessus]MDO3012717.1 DUF732 domain-containing protein [Mycobacteroides abscessus subsp. abscessus]